MFLLFYNESLFFCQKRVKCLIWLTICLAKCALYTSKLVHPHDLHAFTRF